MYSAFVLGLPANHRAAYFNWTPERFSWEHSGTVRVNLIVTRQTVYVKRNIEARSCNHCYRGKEINITYSECMSVTLIM